jgi:hypothetical protein
MDDDENNTFKSKIPIISMPYNDYMDVICENCGQPYGKHSEDLNNTLCPSSE